MSEIRYRPAAGVTSDFERLLRRFICGGSVRYEDFAKIWREMKMSYVYAGRDLEKELKEFIEECLAIALRLFLPPYEFEMRVGGLYLLYALYHTQPFSPKVKVRVTLQQWLDMQDFHAIVKSQHHYDISFILVRLRLDKAFLFVASPTELHPSATEREIEMPPFDVGKPLEIVSAEVAEQVNAVHDQYSKMKRALAGSESEQPDASLDVTQEDLTTTMMDIVKKYEDIAENRLIAQAEGTGMLSSGCKGSNGRSAGARRGGAKSRECSKKELPREGAVDEGQESGCSTKMTKAKRGSAPVPTRLPREGAVDEWQESGCSTKMTKAKRGSAPVPTRGRGRGRGRGASAVGRRVSRDDDISSDSSDSAAETPLARLIESSASAKVRRQRGRPRASANKPVSSAAAMPERKKEPASRKKEAASTESDGSGGYSVHDTSEGTDCSGVSEVAERRAKKRRATKQRAATAARSPAACERQAAKVGRPPRSQPLEKIGDEMASREAATHGEVDPSSGCNDVDDESVPGSPAAGDQSRFLDMPELV